MLAFLLGEMCADLALDMCYSRRAWGCDGEWNVLDSSREADNEGDRIRHDAKMKGD